MSNALEKLIDHACAHGIDVTPKLEPHMFPKQREFVLHKTSRFRSFLCSRRAAKTMSMAMVAVIVAWMFPRSNVLIICATDKAVRDIWMKDVLDVVLSWLHPLPYEKCQSPFKYTLGNGSVIRLHGGGVDDNVQRRLKGIKARLVIIDEAQDFRSDLRDLVVRTVKPMLWDFKGWLIVAGTPGDDKGYFYKITRNKNDLDYEAARKEAADGIPWDMWGWEVFANPHTAEQAREEVASSPDPDFINSIDYKRDYLGKWEFDENVRILNITSENLVEQLPDWSCICLRHRETCDCKVKVPESVVTLMGTDAGQVDDAAYAVVRYAEHDDTLYVVHVEVTKQTVTSEFVAKTWELYNEWDVSGIYCDDVKRNIDDAVQRFQLPILMTPHPSVTYSLKAMNSDLRLGKIKFLPKPFATMEREWSGYVWDVKKRDRGQGLHPKRGQEDHQTDALRYAWNASKHFAATPAELPKTRSQQLEEQMEAAADKRATDFQRIAAWRDRLS